MQQATLRNNAGVFCFFVSFRGRMRRSVYWWSVFLLFFINLAYSALLIYLASLLRYRSDAEILICVGCVLSSIFSSIYSISLTWRRLQDTGHHGALAFLNFIPFVSLIVFILCCYDSTPGDNEWGPNPKGVRGQSNNAAPSSSATLCPVCQGKGRNDAGFICPECGGKGVAANAGMSSGAKPIQQPQFTSAQMKGAAVNAGVSSGAKPIKQPQIARVQVKRAAANAGVSPSAKPIKQPQIARVQVKRASSATPAVVDASQDTSVASGDASAEELLYLIHLDGENLGPYTVEQLAEMLSNSQISPDTLIWTEGMPQWMPYRSIFPCEG